MKKKGIATLALAGALAAATMVPAFAATNDSTTVGYTAGGNASTDGRVMVTIPKDVTFTTKGQAETGFDVKALVWDVDNATWSTPGTIKMGKEITVSVASDNAYKLLNAKEAAGVSGAYEYVVADPDTEQGAQKAVTLNNTNNGTEKVAAQIGVLKDGAGTPQDPAVYTLGGTVTMTTTPNVGQKDKPVFFSDKLVYTFTGMNA